MIAINKAHPIKYVSFFLLLFFSLYGHAVEGNAPGNIDTRVEYYHPQKSGGSGQGGGSNPYGIDPAVYAKIAKTQSDTNKVYSNTKSQLTAQRKIIEQSGKGDSSKAHSIQRETSKKVNDTLIRSHEIQRKTSEKVSSVMNETQHKTNASHSPLARHRR